MKLATALADYDGKHVAFLESLLRRFEPVPEVLTEAVELVDDETDAVATGATWLLRVWLKAGARPSDEQHGVLAARLRDVTAPWARLHLCQTVRLLDALPGTSEAAAWCDFLTRSSKSRRPFERAWAVDGLVHLSAWFPELHDVARDALATALSDPAPSVRARARRLVNGD